MRGTPPEYPTLVGLAEKYGEFEVAQIISDGRDRMPGFAQLEIPTILAMARYLVFGEETEVEQAAESPAIDVPYGHGGYRKLLDPDGYPAVEPPWGTLNAIHLDTGKIAWTVPLGEFPELAARGIRTTGSENYGGPVVTAGGLVFIGATLHDRKFHAFDKANGKLLWETTLPAAGTATPATYMVNGRQYVVIAAGGGKYGLPPGGTYVAFALPEDAILQE